MIILNLSMEHLKIPFKLAFNHSSANRVVTDSILVTASTKYNTGFGESCPRIYVTHETYLSVVDFFTIYKVSIMTTINSLATLIKWIEKHKNIIDENPAAWCAIELSLIDLLAKEKKCTVENFLSLPKLTEDYYYTAVLGESKIKSFRELFSQYKVLGFSDYKIKLSGDIEHDKSKCDLIMNEIENASIRLDANNLWDDPYEAINYIRKLGHNFFGIEEPLQVFDFNGLEIMYNVLKVKIILDESFINLNQFEYIKDSSYKWIINVRVSKMGGILRSLNILEKAKQYNIECIVGAQVGETSILTRAALTVTNAFKENIIAQEGAFGTYLLERDICSPVLMFGKKGILPISQLSNLKRVGFGLNINL